MPSNNIDEKKAHGRSAILSGNPDQIPVGLVGLGLMGSSITTCLLAAGHPVVAVESDAERRRQAKQEISSHLRVMKAGGLLKGDCQRLMNRLKICRSIGDLEGSELVIESIVESVEAKKNVINEIETTLNHPPIVGSNTSAIPVSILQQGAIRPERILGIHWGEPAHVLRFMEIICGSRTDPKYANAVKKLAQKWGKEPSVLHRDIRGFIANRCFYALLREALYLVESGYATIEDVDRSLRNDLGYWITFAGPFRFLDLTGIPAYEAVIRDLFPDLNCTKKVPQSIKCLVGSGARGVSNCNGFYKYTPREAKRWEDRFLRFTYDIRALALKYADGTGSNSVRRSRKR